MDVKNCAFCDIVTHSNNAAVIYEDEDVIIFLDQRPLFQGHSLLIPRQHYETITDLPNHLIEPYFLKLKQMTGVIKEGMAADGVFVAMNNTVSQSVPHLHTHIVPRRRGDGLKGFFWPRQHYQEQELVLTQQRLQDVWKRHYDEKVA